MYDWLNFSAIATIKNGDGDRFTIFLDEHNSCFCYEVPSFERIVITLCLAIFPNGTGGGGGLRRVRSFMQCLCNTI